MSSASKIIPLRDPGIARHIRSTCEDGDLYDIYDLQKFSGTDTPYFRDLCAAFGLTSRPAASVALNFLKKDGYRKTIPRRLIENLVHEESKEWTAEFLNEVTAEITKADQMREDAESYPGLPAALEKELGERVRRMLPNWNVLDERFGCSAVKGTNLKHFPGEEKLFSSKDVTLSTIPGFEEFGKKWLPLKLLNPEAIYARRQEHIFDQCKENKDIKRPSIPSITGVLEAVGFELEIPTSKGSGKMMVYLFGTLHDLPRGPSKTSNIDTILNLMFRSAVDQKCKVDVFVESLYRQDPFITEGLDKVQQAAKKKALEFGSESCVFLHRVNVRPQQSVAAQRIQKLVSEVPSQKTPKDILEIFADLWYQILNHGAQEIQRAMDNLIFYEVEKQRYRGQRSDSFSKVLEDLLTAKTCQAFEPLRDFQQELAALSGMIDMENKDWRGRLLRLAEKIEGDALLHAQNTSMDVYLLRRLFRTFPMAPEGITNAWIFAGQTHIEFYTSFILDMAANGLIKICSLSLPKIEKDWFHCVQGGECRRSSPPSEQEAQPHPSASRRRESLSLLAQIEGHPLPFTEE